MEKKSAVMILKTFFGCKQGQGLKEFNEELKALTPAEKIWMAMEAGKILGVEVMEAPAAAVAA